MALTAAPTTLLASIPVDSRTLVSAASSRSDRPKQAAVRPIAPLQPRRRRVSIGRAAIWSWLARSEGRVPGGDHDGLIEAHIRRLEALRRAGIVERIDADHWRLPQDFESRAAAYDSVRNRQLNIRVLSTFDLESQIEAEGATWLDRRLAGRGPSDLVAAGFGRDVQQAMDRRREHLIGQGDAVSHGDGRIIYRRNLLATLEQRDVIRTGTALAASRSLPFRAAGDGETVQGVFKETVELSSGKFALVENAHEFTLVPWRPVIENRLGREVTGIVQGGSVSWQVGRKLGLSP